MSESNGRRPARPVMHVWPERLAKVGALDTPARALAAVAGRIGPGKIKDALSGTWLGHALHPFLTDLPIGTWTSATILDVIGGEESAAAADRLIGAGVLASLPTAATGTTEWADTERSDENVRRIGVVHATANVVALGLFTGSLLARRRGNRARGKALSFAGMGALTVGGHLGGHLSYAKGVGVDQTTFERRPTDWRRALGAAELGEGERRLVDVEGVGVVVGREQGRLYALANRCCHRGGPLHMGTVADGAITCPWHGSTFRIEDGSVVRGPAAYPQPVYDVRVEDGVIEVRARAV
ncbi:MAG: Rieske 2Fe-2S domain-containing protein [Actinomycetota bacterium]|nr:Rieske 2Fe-2S domain-containing protein [Actinomycetota bacterium]